MSLGIDHILMNLMVVNAHITGLRIHQMVINLMVVSLHMVLLRIDRMVIVHNRRSRVDGATKAQ